MSRNNDVFQVLVPKGNQPVAAVGTKVDALALGQIGVFDANTNLAIDASSNVKDFYLAVGRDSKGTGVVNDAYFSAGQKIQAKGIAGYSFRAHTPGRAKTVEVSDIKGVCNSDFSLKVEFRNQEIYRSQGTVAFSKTYTVRPECCDTCEDCLDADCNVIVKALVNTINNDSLGLLTAVAWDPSANTGAGGEIADIDAFIAANSATNTDDDKTNNVCATIRLTSVPTQIDRFCNVPLKYYYPRQTEVIVSNVSSDLLSCKAIITTIEEAVQEEGNGREIRQKEYHAGGWNGNPGVYKTSTLVGVPTGEFVYEAEANVKYNQLDLTYDTYHFATIDQDFAHLNTTIAIPTADIATLAGLTAVLDAIAIKCGFDPLADDSAAADADDTAIETTTEIDDTDLDGVN